MHKVLIVGVGSIGERHLRCFQNTARAELSLVEIDPDLRHRIAIKYGIEKTYDSVQAAMAFAFDAAVVATPAHTHIEIAISLANAGIHLLIEKPLSTGLDRVEELQQTVRRNHLISMVAYIHRSNPALADMKAAIDSGRFGRPVQLISCSGQHFPTARPAYREIYFADRKTGGGLIQDGLTHLINMGEWLVGPVDRVMADADHCVLEGVEVEDTVQVLARHGSVMAAYCGNLHQAPNELSITVVCEKGTARFLGHRNQWHWMTEPNTEWQVESFDIPERDTLFVKQANTFLNTIEGSCEPVCSLEEGLQTLRVNLAILNSVDIQESYVHLDH